MLASIGAGFPLIGSVRSPSCPRLLSPQQYALPVFISIPHAWLPPALTTENASCVVVGAGGASGVIAVHGSPSPPSPASRGVNLLGFEKHAARKQIARSVRIRTVG